MAYSAVPSAPSKGLTAMRVVSLVRIRIRVFEKRWRRTFVEEIRRVSNDLDANDITSHIPPQFKVFIRSHKILWPKNTS